MTVYACFCVECDSYLAMDPPEQRVKLGETDEYLCRSCWERIGVSKAWSLRPLSPEELQKQQAQIAALKRALSREEQVKWAEKIVAEGR